MVKKKMQTYTQFLFQIGLSVSIRSLVKRTSKINLTCSDGHDGSANLLLGDAPLPTGTPVFFFFSCALRCAHEVRWWWFATMLN